MKDISDAIFQNISKNTQFSKENEKLNKIDEEQNRMVFETRNPIQEKQMNAIAQGYIQNQFYVDFIPIPDKPDPVMAQIAI